MSNSSISVFRVSTGSPIETVQSQSPVLSGTSEEDPLNIWDALTQPIPMVCNPVPKIVSDPLGPLDLSQGGQTGKNI